MDLQPEEKINFLGQPLVPLAHSQLADAAERLEARHAVVGISPQFEIEPANLEGPPAPQVRQEVLQLELRLGMKVQIALHRPDPEGPVVATLCGSPIPNSLTLRELRALSQLFDEAADSEAEL